ncbi:MAG: DUF5000 domain-containing lipoprotein [Chitinophagaceae bacterium]
MKKMLFIFMLSVVLADIGCRPENIEVPSSGEQPSSLTNISVRNVSGGAILHYSFDSNTAYVLAEYETKAGTTRSTKASRYVDSLVVNGFPSVGTYQVSLYAVGYGEKKSTAVTVEVNPLTPPVDSVVKTLEFEPTFGGIVLRYTNPDAAALKIYLLRRDSLTSQWNAIDTFYVSDSAGTLSERGLSNTEITFGVYATDRFNNYSDTVTATLTPLYEEQLSKSKFLPLYLASDYYAPNNSGVSKITNLWDGYTSGGNAYLFATVNGYGFPQSFSFDLGDTYYISRFMHYPRTESGNIYQNTPRYWELYGSNNPVDDWSEWTKIMDCELVKPSGTAPGTYTSADLAYIVNGVNYDFPVGTPAYRYIRWKTLSVFSGANIAIYELTFYGNK